MTYYMLELIEKKFLGRFERKLAIQYNSDGLLEHLDTFMHESIYKVSSSLSVTQNQMRFPNSRLNQ